MSNPLVSIIIPTKNSAEFLEKIVGSIVPAGLWSHNASCSSKTDLEKERLVCTRAPRLCGDNGANIMSKFIIC